MRKLPLIISATVLAMLPAYGQKFRHVEKATLPTHSKSTKQAKESKESVTEGFTPVDAANNRFTADFDSISEPTTRVVIRYADFPDLMDKAKKGDGEAMRRVAICYQTGTGIAKDLDEAIVWYGKAARAGNVEAEYDIGTLYRDGIGFEQDFEESAYWFRKAARNGNTKAMVEIGRQFSEGKGVLQDDKIAAEYFWRAADRGNRDGMRLYSEALRLGRGVPRDEAKAARYLTLSRQ